MIRLGKVARKQIARTASVPAPVKGWNARDPIANMDEDYAILMDNWFPLTSDIMLRKGYDDHVTGITGQIETLMVWNGFTSSKMFAAAGTAFYDVTTGGAVGAAVQSSLTNARWQFVNMTDSSGATWLISGNGVDEPRYYNGSAWTAVTAASSPAITGVTTTTLTNPNIFKERLWFIQTDTLSAWYLPADAVGGAATEYSFESIFRKGGCLRALGTWTLDAGEGMDDHFVVVTSKGEIAVYKGTDPSSASTFALVGIWQLGIPLGQRCLEKVAGDLIYLSVDGAVPLSIGLISDRIRPKSALTDNIREAMTDAARQYGSNFGWQILQHPRQQMLLLNVPVASGQQQQYAMNLSTGAWGRFTGMGFNCWAVLNDKAYAGGNGTVYEVFEDFNDNGANIVGNLKQAFNYFGKRGQKKHFKMLRPIFASDGTPSVALGLNVDYEDQQPTATLSFSASAYAVWDSATWDSGIWGGGLSVLRNWQKAPAMGHCAALRLKVESADIEVRFQACDHVLELGGVI